MNLTTEQKALLKQALTILQNENHWHSASELSHRLGVNDTRKLRREVIAPLRFHYRIPIHSRPGDTGGYKLGGITAKEHIHCRKIMKNMARDFFAIESVLRCESLDTVFAQMTMSILPKDADSLFPEDRDDQDSLSMLIDQESRVGRRTNWIDVVDKLLTVMAEKPDAYAEDIDRISRKHGGLFISAGQREELQAHARAIQDMLNKSGTTLPKTTGVQP